MDDDTVDIDVVGFSPCSLRSGIGGVIEGTVDERRGGGGGGGWTDFFGALVDKVESVCISVVVDLRMGMGGGPELPHFESSTSTSALFFFGTKLVSSSS